MEDGNKKKKSKTKDSKTSSVNSKPEWLEEYSVVGKIGEGTYGLVFLAKTKSSPEKTIAIKKFKPTKDGDEVSQSTIREIALLREFSHENLVKLINVHTDMSLNFVLDYAEYDLNEIISHHRNEVLGPISQYTVKSVLWQLLNGLRYLHGKWIVHRDLKPSNILVMGDGEEHGMVKIADFGLGRINLPQLKLLSDDGAVVSTWYRAPELLLGAEQYPISVDMWSVGCIFAELLLLRPVFQGAESKSGQEAFQVEQLKKIFKILGQPTVEKWPMLANLPHWKSDVEDIQSYKYKGLGLHNEVNLDPKSSAYDLMSKMLEYDPLKRITTAEALEHEFFRVEPLPGRNALVATESMKNVVKYPTRRVDTSTDFEGKTSMNQPQGTVGGNVPSQQKRGRDAQTGSSTRVKKAKRL